MNAIDTNVLVYMVDSDQPGKREVAVNVVQHLAREAGSTWLLYQVAAEFLACLCRAEQQGRLSREEVLQRFELVRLTFSLKLPTSQVLNHAIDLRSRYSLSHWDSLLLAACVEAG